MNGPDPRDGFDDGDPDGRDGLAAEYALGTLDALERAEVAARLDVDPELADAVARWETLLAPLLVAVPPVAPPAHVWQGLVHRLDALADRPRRRLASAAARPARSAAGWRSVALAASLAALVLGGLMARDRLAEAPAAEPLVAVLQTGGAEPAYVVSVALADGRLTIRRVGASAPVQNAHELWLVADANAKPVSLGVVGAGSASAALRGMDPVALESATYAISLEPQGGSPTGLPTGPVLFSGKLMALPQAQDVR